MNAIDPGEAALAVIGVRAVISRKVGRVTAAQRKDIVSLPSRLYRLASKLCNGGLDAPAIDVPTYAPLLDDLSEPFNVTQVERMVARLPAEAQLPFMTAGKRAFDFLQAAIPRSVTRSVAGARNAAVPDIEYFRFLFKLCVLDDPLLVFSLAANGSLLASQVAAVRVIYPTLASAIDAAIQESVVDDLTVKKSFELPYEAEIGVRVWFGNPVNALPYQESYIAPDKVRKPQPTSSDETALSKESLSSAQSALYGQLGKR